MPLTHHYSHQEFAPQLQCFLLGIVHWSLLSSQADIALGEERAKSGTTYQIYKPTL